MEIYCTVHYRYWNTTAGHLKAEEMSLTLFFGGRVADEDPSTLFGLKSSTAIQTRRMLCDDALSTGIASSMQENRLYVSANDGQMIT